MNALQWAVALQILSVALLFAEIFLPSGGILALATTGALVGSLLIGFSSSALEGWILLGLDLAVFPFLVWWGFKKVETSSMALPERLASGGGGEESLQSMVGRIGVTETDMRPVGRIRFGNQLHDGQSRSGFILGGVEVEVLSADGNHLIVKPVHHD